MRYFVEIQYKGNNYHGWQIQRNATTVQGIIDKALSVLCQRNIHSVGSSRTDTGVHCLQQYAHFDTDMPLDVLQLQQKLNLFLPHDIAIKTIKQVKSAAHARFSASTRTYHYLITWLKNPFAQEKMLKVVEKPNIEQLNLAAKQLLDFTDFKAFSKVKAKTQMYECIIRDSSWKLLDCCTLKYTITANRFLRGMVRIIVGNLLLVAKGKMCIEELRANIQSKERKHTHHLVPAHGLYLAEVTYPTSIWLV